MPAMVNVEYIRLSFHEEIKEEEKTALEVKARQLSEALIKDPDMTKTAQAHQLEVQESGLFSSEQPNLNLGFSYALLKRIFELNFQEISEPITTSEGIYIVKLKEKTEGHLAGFEEAKKKVEEAVILTKAETLAKAKAEEYQKKFKETLNTDPSQDIKTLAQTEGLTVEQTPDFTRGQYLPNIGLSNEFENAAFALNNENKVSGAAKTPKGYCILYFDKLTPVAEEQFAKEKDQFAKTIIDARKGEAFNEFLAKLRIKANLQDNVSKLKSNSPAQPQQ